MNSSTVDHHSSEPVAESDPGAAADIIGGLLVETGLISADRLRWARRIQDRLPNRTDLVTILEELRVTTRNQVREALKIKQYRIPVKLSDLLMELGYIREA